MSKTKVRQSSQVRKSDTYDDALPSGATLETASTDIESDLNGLRSQVNKIIGQTNWFDAPNNTLEDVVANTDELVKVSADDTTAGYLEAKIVGGTNIAVSTLNPAGDEDLQISLTGTQAGFDDTAIHDNVAGEIAAVTAKASPTASDRLLIEDAAAANAKKSITIGSINHDSLTGFVANEHIDWTQAGAGTIHTSNYIEGGPGTDTDAIHDNVAGEIAAIAAKATPTGADYLLIEDAAAGNAKKRITIADLPGGGGGDVTGPGSATDNAIARFDGATGKIIQNSGVYISDTDDMTSLKTLTFEEPFETIVAGSPTNIDWANGTLQRIYLTQNVSLTFTAPPEPPAGAVFRGAILTLRVVQSGLGGFTITWPASVSGTEPTLNPLTGEANSTVVQFLFDGTTLSPAYFFLNRGGAGTPGADLWWGPYGLSYDMWANEDAKFLWRAQVELVHESVYGAVGATEVTNTDPVAYFADASSRHHDVTGIQVTTKRPEWRTSGPLVLFNDGVSENYGVWEQSQGTDFAFIYNAPYLSAPYTEFAILLRVAFHDDPTTTLSYILQNTIGVSTQPGFALYQFSGSLIFAIFDPAAAFVVSTPVTWATNAIVDIAIVRFSATGRVHIYVNNMGTSLSDGAYVGAGTDTAGYDLKLGGTADGVVTPVYANMSLYGLVMLGSAPDEAGRNKWFEWMGGVDFSDAPSIATGAAGLTLLDWGADRGGFMLKLGLPVLLAAPEDDVTQAYEIDLGTSWTVL